MVKFHIEMRMKKGLKIGVISIKQLQWYEAEMAKVDRKNRLMSKTKE